MFAKPFETCRESYEYLYCQAQIEPLLFAEEKA